MRARAATVYALSASSGRGHRQPRRYLPYRLVNSGVPQKMTESAARLRGDQLTLGYGAIPQKTLMFLIPDGHFTAIGPIAAVSQRYYARCRLMTLVDGHVG